MSMPGVTFDFDVTLRAGEDRALDVTLTEPDGVTPVDLSSPGILLWFTAKRLSTDADADALIQRTRADGITTTNAVAGQVTIAIPGAATDGLAGVVDLFCDVRMLRAGLISVPLVGRVRVTPTATRARA